MEYCSGKIVQATKRIFEAQGKGGMQNSKITGIGFTEQKQLRNKVKYIPFSDSFAVTVSQFVFRTGGPIAFALSPPQTTPLCSSAWLPLFHVSHYSLISAVAFFKLAFILASEL